MKKPDGFMLFFDRLEPMRNLANEEIGAIFRAIWDYAEAGVIPDLPNSLQPYWTVLRLSVDRNVASYNETSIKNRYNRYKGEIKKSNQEAAEFWEWWAAQPDYTKDLFRKEVWYDDAAASYQRRLTTVDDGQQASRSVTNQTQTKHEPNTITNPNPNTNPSKESAEGGVEGTNRNDSKPTEAKPNQKDDVDWDEAQEAWNRYLETRESVGNPIKDIQERNRVFERVKLLAGNDPAKYAEVIDKMTEVQKQKC